MFNFQVIFYFTKKELIFNLKNFFIIILSLVNFFLNFFLLYFSNVFYVNIEELDYTVIFLSIIHLQMFVIPLFSLLLSYDIILLERESGILNLLLSYPFKYHNVLFGKIFGYFFVLCIAFFIGFIPNFIFLSGISNSGSFFIFFILLCFLLNFIFILIGTYISLLFKDRTIVILCSIICWLFFVFFYDFFFIIFLILNDTIIVNNLSSYFLLLNPVEIFRVCAIMCFSPSIIEEIFGFTISTFMYYFSIVLLIFWIVILFVLLPKLCSIFNKRNQYV